MNSKVSGNVQVKIQKNLLAWFSKNKRPMPWRSQKSPYRTFISEVMLQQTQIKTVIPYFERWMKVFPDIESLAAAPIDKVLKLWEGLGYYTRARNLHKAAQMICEKHGGKIPSDFDSLFALPGIGRYTAGAIASIGFEKRVPLVDGNVARVLSRLFNIKKDILKPETQKFLYEIAGQLVPEKSPGDFNQALMELGSLICIPAMPNCTACPVSSVCSAYKKGNQESLPIKSKALQKKEVRIAAAFILNDGKILVRKRPAKGIWGGLWEVPSITSPVKNSFRELIERYIHNEYKMKAAPIASIEPITHHLTHLKMTISPFVFKTNQGHVNSGSRWVSRSGITKLSFPVPYQSLLKTTFEQYAHAV